MNFQTNPVGFPGLFQKFLESWTPPLWHAIAIRRKMFSGNNEFVDFDYRLSGLLSK